MPKTVYMAFCFDAPFIGLDPHPACAPDRAIESFDAEGYAKALHAVPTREALQNEIEDDFEAALDAYKDGYLEDVGEMDVVHRVRITDDGIIAIFDTDMTDIPFATHTVAEVYEAFGMTMPERMDA